ncbi:hypothetical protein [Xylophilus ampelinus]|uniref:Bacteriophage CI repressor-like protein n=1 Tax=Xylophilus ampelinus TaxID=54067 RepID=A0A318SL73_9BURK|nr:hypothetical protein [Xylophilus ampelinus]MCS4510399.1 hypothetical protein [Xylophilus ampelinus]PYE77981.1 hypothetical protein DFQ15_1105 [Xylophilus ampelinus]
MYFDVLENLTAEDRRRLAEHGVPSSRISEWRSANRLPTRSQALALATVKNLDFGVLERELTILEMKKDSEKNAGFQHLMTRLKGAWQFS